MFAVATLSRKRPYWRTSWWLKRHGLPTEATKVGQSIEIDKHLRLVRIEQNVLIDGVPAYHNYGEPGLVPPWISCRRCECGERGEHIITKLVTVGIRSMPPGARRQYKKWMQG